MEEVLQMCDHERVVGELGRPLPLFGCGPLVDRLSRSALRRKQSADFLVDVVVSLPETFAGRVHGRPGGRWRRRGRVLLAFVFHDFVMRPENTESDGKELVERTEEQEWARRG